VIAKLTDFALAQRFVTLLPGIALVGAWPRPCRRPRKRHTELMARKASVVIEKDEYGCYAWCPELKGCQSQGNSIDEALANIKEAIELYLETSASRGLGYPPQP
jgi:predicted RNase H-like HicB family nuclease